MKTSKEAAWLVDRVGWTSQVSHCSLWLKKTTLKPKASLPCKKSYANELVFLCIYP